MEENKNEQSEWMNPESDKYYKGYKYQKYNNVGMKMVMKYCMIKMVNYVQKTQINKYENLRR